MNSETDIKLEVMEYLKLRNIPANRNQAGKIKIGARWINLGKSGWPDVIAVLPPHGIFLGIEVKKPGEELSGKQEKVKYDIEQARGIVIMVTSVEELAEKLKEIDTGEIQDLIYSKGEEI